MTDSKGKKILKGTGIYAIGTFGTKFLSFLIVPLYTYYLATADYGIYDVLMSTISLLTPIITLQISDAAYKYIISDEVSDKNKYIKATVQVLTINCLLASVIIYLVSLFFDIPYLFYFIIVLVLTRGYQTILKILRGLKNQWLFAISGIAYTLVFLLMNVISLCVFHSGVECLFQSTIVASIVSILLMYIFEPRLRINYLGKSDGKLIKEMYAYSAPLVPNYLNWWVINSSDRYIVMIALGAVANGILAVAHKFPTMLQAVLQLFTNSWTDESMADSDLDTGEFHTKVFRQFYLISFSMLLFIIPATKVYIQLFMSEAYKQSCDYVAFYYIGTVFQSFASFYGVGYLKSGSTGKAFTTSIYGAIVNAAINLALIWVIGLQAAAVSTFLGFFVMWLVREKQNRNELKININWSEMILYIIAVIAMSIISIYSNTIINIILSLAGGLYFAVSNGKNAINILKKKK